MKRVDNINEINAIINLVKNGIVDFVDGRAITDKDNSGETIKGNVYEDGKLNFFAVRDKVINNRFNDIFYMYWKDGNEWHCYRTELGFTTKSGFKSIKIGGEQPVLLEGWHRDIWTHGTHKVDTPYEYPALVQYEPARFKRALTPDPSTGLFNYDSDNKDKYILNTSVETSIFNMNIALNLHRSVPNGCSTYVDDWSAGCQVFADSKDFDFMMTAADERKNRQPTFSYFICTKEVYKSSLNLNQVDVPEPYNASAVGGSPATSRGRRRNNSTSSSSRDNDNVSQSNAAINTFSMTNIVTEDDVRYTILGNSFNWANSFIKDKEIFAPDNNNEYINLSSDKIEVKVIDNPSLTVDELNISNKSYATMGVYPEQISYSIPIVFINNFMIPQTNITNFCLDYSSFVPQVMVEFVDITNELLTTNIPKPGSYIKVFIGGYPKTEYKDFYNPIRQNFVITNISKTNKTAGEYQNYPNSGNPLKYKITGILNVPLGFAKQARSTGEDNKMIAMEALKIVSKFIGLGFATNFNLDDEKSTNLYNDDIEKARFKMNWMNTQNKSLYDFLREITQHSGYSKYTFFTSFIDQYYVLNYVECRSLLSRGGDKEDTKQIIYNCIMPEMDKTKTDVEQKTSYYFLTNSAEYKGWTNYIEEYYELNDGYSMMTDGLTKFATYDDDSGAWYEASKTRGVVLKAVDNLERDEDGIIKSLPERVDIKTYIPLNLVETTDPAYVKSRKYCDSPVAAQTQVSLGVLSSSNTYPLYPFAPIQNDFQMKNLKKCGLSIRLQNYNPAITKYSRIWVDLYDMNRNSMTQIRKDPSIDNMEDNSQFKEYLRSKNDNIIAFNEETLKDTENQVYNRSLSGWYVITEMKISYNTVKDFKGGRCKKLQTHLILNRIDYRPSFYSEYDIAKKSIEVYRDDPLTQEKNQK